MTCPQLEANIGIRHTAVLSIRNRLCRLCVHLAGYTLGRSDLLRRAMSKKKADVMEKERQNFVYGNEEEGVPGCVANGNH